MGGVTKTFIKNPNLKLTDVLDNDWVDEYQDASNLTVPDNSQDVIICSHMIHHIANPAKFLDQVAKKLKLGGRLIIQDIYTGLLMKLALRIMRHEGWSDSVDIYDRNAVCNDPSDPWSANCSIPKLLFFGNSDRFQKEFPQYRVIQKQKNECFLFLTSGGVNYKTIHLPLTDRGVSFIKFLDKILIKILPGVFTCGCSVVLEKKGAVS